MKTNSYILLIESTTTVCSVALAKNDEVIFEKSVNEGYSHSENLAFFIQQAFSESNVPVSELSAVAISRGPGSYTGLRIGTSLAKGICTALNIPLIACDTLKALTFHPQVLEKIENTPAYLLPMIDARRMEVYTAVFDEYRNEIKPVEPHVVKEDSFVEFNDKLVLLFGNGADKLKNVEFHNSNIRIIENIELNAVFMLPEARERYKTGLFEDVAYFEPFYLKSFQATKPKKKF
jgi:tRNA threonylcarbamoyladenosine biosynthesis protein TsaB